MCRPGWRTGCENPGARPRTTGAAAPSPAQVPGMKSLRRCAGRGVSSPRESARTRSPSRRRLRPGGTITSSLLRRPPTSPSISFTAARRSIVAEGQLAAALAEVLLRGFSQPRLKRVVGLLRAQTTKFSTCRANGGANFQKTRRSWTPRAGNRKSPRSIPRISLTAATPDRASSTSSTPSASAWRRPPRSASACFKDKALAIWRKALTDAPAEALDVTLAGLRVDDGLEPTVSVVWGPAAAIAAVPRPYTWLVGLTSRSWPRRASEDPLLPPSHRSLFPA